MGGKKTKQSKKFFSCWHALVRQLAKRVNTSLHMEDHLIETFPCACSSFSGPFKNKSQRVFFSLYFLLFIFFFHVLERDFGGNPIFGGQRCALGTFWEDALYPCAVLTQFMLS